MEKMAYRVPKKAETNPLQDLWSDKSRLFGSRDLISTRNRLRHIIFSVYTRFWWWQWSTFSSTWEIPSGLFLKLRKRCATVHSNHKILQLLSLWDCLQLEIGGINFWRSFRLWVVKSTKIYNRRLAVTYITFKQSGEIKGFWFFN